MPLPMPFIPCFVDAFMVMNEDLSNQNLLRFQAGGWEAWISKLLLMIEGFVVHVVLALLLKLGSNLYA